jgi:bacteriorhodopsin
MYKGVSYFTELFQTIPVQMPNQALKVNPFIVNGRTVDIHITVQGSDWYSNVMSVMGTTMLTIIGAILLRPRTHRVFHHILVAVALVAMIEHYSMASNLGWVPIDVEWQQSNPLVAGVNRQIWWVRF